MPKPLQSLSDLDEMMHLASLFETAKADDPGLSDARVDQVLRLIPGKRAILAGHFNDTPAVFRMSLLPDDDTPTKEWTEQTRIWPHMHDGDYRVAKPLYHSASHGIVIAAKARGTPLLKHIRATKAPDRAGVLQPVAGWLRKYTQTTEDWRPATPGKWVARAEQALTQQPHRPLRRTGRGIVHEIRRLSECFQGDSWRTAICHGDFHPNNLIIDGHQLTGIDTGGSSTLPVYKDMTRFLVHMGRRGVIPSGNVRFGVDGDGIKAFADAFDLTARETTLYLPFMLGCEALLRVETETIKPARLKLAVQMYRRLLTDLRQVSPNAP